MPGIMLFNKTPVMRVFNLPHEFMCAEGGCCCTQQRYATFDHDAESGAMRSRYHDRSVPTSTTLLSRHWSCALPQSVLNAPEISAAVEAGDVIYKDAE